MDPASGLSSFVANEVMDHNLGNMNLINRSRTERLIVILRTINGFKIGKSRLLIIGPRNEAEILLFVGYGAKLRKYKIHRLFSRIARPSY